MFNAVWVLVDNSHWARDGWFVMRLQDLVIALQLLSLCQDICSCKRYYVQETGGCTLKPLSSRWETTLQVEQIYYFPQRNLCLPELRKINCWRMPRCDCVQPLLLLSAPVPGICLQAWTQAASIRWAETAQEETPIPKNSWEFFVGYFPAEDSNKKRLKTLSFPVWLVLT